MISRYNLLISAVGCWILFNLAAANAEQPVPEQNGRSNWLTGLDFKLESTISLFDSTTHRVRILNRLTEYYSNDQKRAVLEINQDGRAYKNVRYTYLGNNQLVRQGRDGSGSYKCKLATNNDLAQDLFGGQLNGESFWNLNGDQDDALPNYLIGPARLGFWIRTLKDKWIPTGDFSSKDSTPYKYRYDFKQKSEADYGEFSDVLIYESMLPSRAPSQLPLRVTIRSPMKDELIFKYSRVRLIDYHGPLKQKATAPLDRFMVPINRGCSENFKPINMLQAASSGRKESPLIASFRATIMSILHPMYLSKPTEVSYFVAYDGHAGVMRRDTIGGMTLTGAPTHNSITISDFHRRRKYNIRQSTSQRDEMGLFEMVREDTESQCVATRIYNEQALMSMDRILPFDSMVEMGQTPIRGVRCMVYETTSSSEFLPAIFFPATSYINANYKGFVTQNEPIGLNLKGTGNHTIVYFFALGSGDQTTRSLLKSSDGKPLGPLMHVEIFHEGSMVHEIDVEGFVWQLMDAPNGDRASELFNIRDKCSRFQLGAESFASLNMELETELGDQPNIRITNSSSDSSNRNQLIGMLESPLRRNEAIYRALVQNTSLTPTQIHNLESRIHHPDNIVSQLSNDRIIIRVNAKLVRPSTSEIYQAMNIGRTSLTSAIRAVPKYLVGTMKFADCYWDAVHKQRHDNNVVFAYCFPYCAMEDGVRVERNKNNFSITIENMQKFSLGENLTCPVYLVSSFEQEEEAQYETTREEWFWFISKSLREKSLVLSILQEDGSSQGIEFTPRKVEIGSDRWSVSGTSSHFEERALEGIGLVATGATAASGGVIQVAPKGKGERLEDSEEEGEGTMSYALCHSSCVSSFDCKSFSLCSTSGQLQCLLSGIEFRDFQILEQIERKSAELRGTKKRGTITVQYKTDGDDDATKNQTEAQGSDSSIDLRVDRRCHLYNKRALELFSPASLSRVELKNRNLIAIDSEEQCAELCLRRNMLYFRRAALIRSNYIDSSKDSNTNDGAGERSEFMAELRAKEERNLRSWCDSFAYMETGKLQPSELAKIGGADKLAKIGICHISRPQATASANSNAKNTTKTEASVLVDMHRYEFIYSSLYEPYKQPGLMLLGSQILDAAKLDELKLEEAHNFLSKSNNQASMSKQTPEACARACFMQSVKLRPWCRSFGFTQRLKTNPFTGERAIENWCIFNSNTMANILRAQKNSKASGDEIGLNQPSSLVSQVPGNMSYQHYEPKNLLSLDNVVVSTHIYLDGGFDASFDRMTTTTNGGRRVRLHTMGVVVLISLALISGLGLGVALSAYLGRISSRRNSYDSQNKIFGYNTSHAYHIPHQRFGHPQGEFDVPELEATI